MSEDRATKSAGNRVQENLEALVYGSEMGDEVYLLGSERKRVYPI